MNNPLGLALVKETGNHTRQRKNLLTSVGIEPTTSGLDLPLLCRLSYNIHMYPYILFAAIYHLKSSPTFSVRPCSSVGRVTVDLIRRSWVRFPPRSKDFFFASCGSLFPFTGANAQWVIHGFKKKIIKKRLGDCYRIETVLTARPCLSDVSLSDSK